MTNQSATRVPALESAAAPAVAVGGTVALYGTLYLAADIDSGILRATQRYFAGHPIAIIATVMFLVAAGILAGKSLRLARHRIASGNLHDDDLAPPTSTTPRDQWSDTHDTAAAAARWYDHLRETFTGNDHPLVRRLIDLTGRQRHRGSAATAADDARDLSERAADASHASYGLVRIIVWAIPMLGFLGTVIGITQTMGGLDFTDGESAVASLRTGLNVAFDTTALGLVLSVVAIFAQWPIERGERRMAESVDARAAELVGRHLPAADDRNAHADMVRSLCDGVRVAVRESLAEQTELWRDTIDQARERWDTEFAQRESAVVDGLNRALLPALSTHAEAIAAAGRAHAAPVQSVVDELRHATDVLGRVAESIDSLPATADTLAAEAASLQISIDEAATTFASRPSEPPRPNHSNDELIVAAKVLAKAADRLSATQPPLPRAA